MKLRIGYKVVRRKNGSLVSAIINDKKFITTYEVGELTKPKAKGTKLMAFINLADAKFFNCNDEIWEAILVDPEPLQQVVDVPVGAVFYDAEEIQTHWNHLISGTAGGHFKKNYLGCAPSGSHACSQIQLIKRVE